MIIQGDNKPIILEMDEEVIGIKYFSAVLFGSSVEPVEYKRWNENDITVDKNQILLPMDQEDTMKIDDDIVVLEIKLVSNGNIEFFDKTRIYVQKRHDKTVFPIGGDGA